MRSRLLPLVLASAITLSPSQARAAGGDSLLAAILAVVVVGTVAVATTEVLTGVATYKNYRSWKDEREASAGWVGVGGVGGLFNVGLGAYLFAGGLPRDVRVPCDREPGEPPSDPRAVCSTTTPASAPKLVIGTLMAGFGGFSVAMAIQAARTDARPAPGAMQTGAMPVGFMLPPLRF